MAKQTEIFAKYKLSKLKIGFMSFIVRFSIIRYFYYIINKKFDEN